MRALRLAGGPVVRFHDLAGAGVPVVFVHGLGCASSGDYPAVARDAALAGRRCVLLDLPGYGFSDKPDAFAYGVEAHAGVVGELVAHLGADAVDLFGHSMGGAVAIAAATRLGARVRRLALSEPNLDPGGGDFSRPVAAMPEDEYAARGHRADVDAAAATGNHAWAGTAAVASPRAMHRDSVSLVAGGRPSWRAQLLALAAPRTLVFGARSLPHADHAGLPAQGVRVEVVPDAGHSMATENPAGLAAALAHAFGRPCG